MKEHTHEDHFPHDHDIVDSKTDPLMEAYNVLRTGQLYTGHSSHNSHHPIESIREFEYKGNKVIIKTHYSITVNDQMINPHIFVDNKGHLTTHALPNYSFNSAVDMIKSIIDCMHLSFPHDKVVD